MAEITVRPTIGSDQAAILELYPRAFPDEDLRALVRDLWGEPSGIVSLTACIGEQVAGHVALALGNPGSLLGPLAVDVPFQRQGVGRALVEAGCAAVAEQGQGQVFLLGDPKYYSRLGFSQERQVRTPLPTPDSWAAAWQSRLAPGFEASGPCVLDVPEIWRVPAYWA